MNDIAETIQETVQNDTQRQLKSYVERIENLEEDKANVSLDIKEVYSEAKGNGFDVKALRAIIKIRTKDPQELSEEEAILETYMMNLGMIPKDDKGSDV